MPEATVVKNGNIITIAAIWGGDQTARSEGNRLDPARLTKKFRFASGRDPLTPPHTKIDCSKICDSILGKYCCQYTTYYQWMYFEWYAVVSTASGSDVSDIVYGCLQESAIIAAITAIITAWAGGGGAALESAKIAFCSALMQCINSRGPDVLNIQVVSDSQWGDWETS